MRESFYDCSGRQEVNVGIEIQRDRFRTSDQEEFSARLGEQLQALEVVLARPGFGSGARTLGAELELGLVDDQGKPVPLSTEIVRAANTPLITPEMGAFDIELSTPPVRLAGSPFSSLASSIRGTVRQIQFLARERGARAVPISILPTLHSSDFENAITDLPRYRALARGMVKARRSAFQIRIEGEDRLSFSAPNLVSLEAANTAFQLHLSTQPDEFVDLFNAALLLSGPVLAAAGNSPTFLGRRLWHETRVALFKQAGDDRPNGPDSDMGLPPRVNFGNGWVRKGAHEIFMESVALHPVLLPECGEAEDSLQLAQQGGIPRLRELCVHHGTVWSWNRPVYDANNGGSLRIELRALPAGPSYDDMLANGCFLAGAMLGLKPRVTALVGALPFPLAKKNFVTAARSGLDAVLEWPTEAGRPPRSVCARDLLLKLLPVARQGLLEAGVEQTEIDYFLGIFAERVRSGVTGAVWQLKVLDDLAKRGIDGSAASTALLQRYIAGFESEQPVHTWPIVSG